jgi:hypothetical protein
VFGADLIQRGLAGGEIAGIEFHGLDTGFGVEGLGGSVVPGVAGDDQAPRGLQRGADGSPDTPGSPGNECDARHGCLPDFSWLTNA